MTLQVGLVARNGFVLASDRKAVRNFRTLPEAGSSPRLTTSAKIIKILASENERLVCAFSGTDYSATVAQRMVNSCPAQFDNESQIRKFLTETSRGIERGSLGNELVIAAVPNAQGMGTLWGVTLGQEPLIQAHRSKVIGGEETNPAVYLIESYYQESLSVDELIRLAAHFICEGHRLSPCSVDGLDIFVWEHGGRNCFLGEGEKQALVALSASIRLQYKRMIFQLEGDTK
jgi:20S proteasome alpha/beta subunit